MFLGSRTRPVHKADNLSAICEVTGQCEILNISQTYKPPRPVTGICLRFYFYAQREKEAFITNWQHWTSTFVILSAADNWKVIVKHLTIFAQFCERILAVVLSAFVQPSFSTSRHSSTKIITVRFFSQMVRGNREGKKVGGCRILCRQFDIWKGMVSLSDLDFFQD
jgi:hypothetical protein